MLNAATLSPTPRILLLMGVAGSGKTTIGRQAAAALCWPYFEADDFHSAANKDKMARGIPLNDDDRAPWLAALRARMDEVRAAGGSAVFTCSALKEKYRQVLVGGAEAVTVLVYLSGDFATILERVGRRQGHYLKADLVKSQFEALEPPQGALALDVQLPPAEIVRAILAHLARG